MDGLAEEVLSATWAANVGVPLAIALASLLFGVRAVGRQLRHDRELLNAQRRAGAAQDVGWELREIADSVDGMDLDDPQWRREWDGWTIGLKVLNRASVPLGRMDGFYDILREISWIWRGAVAAKHHHNVDNELHAWVLGDLVTPNLQKLRLAARELITWDGLGEPPVPQSSSMPMPTDRTAHRTWGRDQVRQYKAMVDESEAKGYPRAVPRPDVSSWLESE